MTQRLSYEKNWDQTVSEKDRELIEKLHTNISELRLNQVLFHIFRVSKNHLGDLLVTVLIENSHQGRLIFENETLDYFEEHKCLASYQFSIPQLIIPGYTNMPWTFIFPASSLVEDPKFREGNLNYRSVI